jgi:uncharacterized membrane protein YgdD (TMEM256/DUF423 family)
LNEVNFSRYLVVLAGVFGAAGVTLSAVAAHNALPGLATAANFLLFHAPALLALSILATNRFTTTAAWLLASGVLLFSGDLIARAYLGSGLFPYAAPTGGLSMIAGWLGIAVAGLVRRPS